MKQFFIWLLNLPTNITSSVPKGTVCDYCGATSNLVNFEDTFCICHCCMKKIADSVLKTSNINLSTEQWRWRE